MSIISLETSHSPPQSSSSDQQYDLISFEMVDGHQLLCSGNAHSSRSQCIPLYGCQSLWMGSSSRTDESILLWSLIGRPIPTPYQYVGNNGLLSHFKESHQIYSSFLCHDFYRQYNNGLLYKQTRRNTFSQPMHRGIGDSQLVLRTRYHYQSLTYPRQIHCFGRLDNLSLSKQNGHWISRERHF